MADFGRHKKIDPYWVGYNRGLYQGCRAFEKAWETVMGKED